MTYPTMACLFGTLLVASCSASNAVQATSDASVDGRGGDALDFDTADPDCAEDPADIPPGAVCVHAVKGKAVELDGSPFRGAIVTICGSVCYYSKTDDDGAFSAHVGRHIVLARYHVLIHGRPDHGSLFAELPAADSAGVVTLAAPVAVPKYDAVGPALPPDDGPASTLAAGDVTLKIPAGVEFQLDVEDVSLGDAGRLLRSGRWTSPAMPTFASGQGLVSLYALGPFTAETCNKTPCTKDNLVKFGVELPNSTGLAAGTPVEFVVLGTELIGPPVTAGTAIVAASGAVSADGKTITTSAGEGLSVLSYIGVRVKK